MCTPRIRKGEDEFIGPSLGGHYVAVHAYRCGYGSEYGCTHGAYGVAAVFGSVDYVYQVAVHIHVFRIHAVFCQVFHIDFAIIAAARVQCQESTFHPLYFEAFKQFAAEVQSGGRCHHGTLFFGKDALVAFLVSRFCRAFYVIGQRGLAEGVERLLKFIVGRVVEKTQCASARSGVVYHFGHHAFVRAEIQFVAYSYFSGRLYEHVPELIVGV